MQTQYNQARGRVGRQGRGREAGGGKLKRKNSSRVALWEEPRGQIQPHCWMQQEQPISFQVWGDKESTELGGGSWGKFLSPPGSAAENRQCTRTSTIPAGRALLHPYITYITAQEAPQSHRIPQGFGLEGTLKATSFQPSARVRTPSTIPGCSGSPSSSAVLPSSTKIHHHSPASYKPRKKVLHTLNLFKKERTLKPHRRKTLSKHCFEDWPVGQQ